jgi:hypothetical protein
MVKDILGKNCTFYGINFINIQPSHNLSNNED